MAKFGEFQFGTAQEFGTGTSGGGGGGGGTGPYMDYTVIVNMAAATEVLTSQSRIEIQAGGKWDDVTAVDWVVPAADNSKRDDRPVPHPDWP